MPGSPSPLLDTLARFRREVDKRDAAAIKQLANAYSKLYKRLQNELELEVRRMFEQDSVSRVYVANRLADLSEQIEDELKKYSGYLETTIGTTADDALMLGSKHAVELMRLATLGTRDIIGIDFNKLPVAAIETMVGFLSPGSTLYKRIGQMARFHTPAVREQLVEGIALGFNPYKVAGNIEPFLRDIAQKFQVAMARPFADAVRMARTSQLWAYREANRANYIANSDVISGWSWFAQLDGLVCGSCLSMHGSIHPLDEQLEGHHHCRCTPVPVVLGNPLIPEGAGQAWFDAQSEETQRGILGPGALDAYKSGAFEFGRLSKQVQDDVFGTIRTVTPLKDLLMPEEV